MTTTTPPAGQASSDGTTGNDGTGPVGASAPPQPASQDLNIKRHGKDIKVPAARVPDLVAKGFDYEQKMAEIGRTKAQLAEYEAFKGKLDASPAMRDAVSRAFQNPELVLQALSTQSGTSPGNDGDGAASGAAPVDQTLLRQVAELDGKLRDLQAREADRTINQTVESELKTYPWVAESKAASKQVREYVAAQIQAGSREPIAALVGSAASDIAEMLQEQQTNALARAQVKQSFQTLNPNRGSPAVSPPPALNASSFRDGKLAAALAQRSKELLGG